MPRTTLSLQSVTRLLFLSLLAATLCGTAMSQKSNTGAVYVMTNRAEGNSVEIFSRGANGGLKFIREVPTQGLGTGATRDPLMSQGALRLSNDGHLLFAVNPASGELTAFVVTPDGLEFGSKVLSGGTFPVSVTEFGGVVYVVNQLGIPNISGFTVDSGGKLQPISNSTRELAGEGLALPAEVRFTPDGKQLLVTEKGTAQIDIFAVQDDGRTTGPAVQPSSGKVPFGFTFGPNSSVVVTEAQGALPKKGSTSSYRLDGDALGVVSASVPDMGTAACWVVITGQTAWVVNTVTGTISAYAVGANGQLSLLNPVAANLGTAVPIDLIASPDGKYLYQLESATGGIAVFQVNGNSLTPLFNKTGLPLSIQGIAAR
jgi:6-phosphogluconolactonase (cycloisomerase 2 family)